MTPEIASEPYCAAAPSRSTSMRPTALVAMRSTSTGVEPPDTRLRLLMSEVVWRRLPLTSTSR